MSVALVVIGMTGACTNGTDRTPTPIEGAGSASPSASPASGSAAALLRLPDLPQSFKRVPGSRSSPTSFRICDLRIGKGAPSGFEVVGRRVFSQTTFGRIEEVVSTAAPADIERYLDEVKRAAKSCKTFAEGHGDTRRRFFVGHSGPGELGPGAVILTIRQTGQLPLGFSIVFASRGRTLIRMVDLGAGSPLELALARSLTLGAMSRLGPES